MYVKNIKRVVELSGFINNIDEQLLSLEKYKNDLPELIDENGNINEFSDITFMTECDEITIPWPVMIKVSELIIIDLNDKRAKYNEELLTL